MELAEFRSSLDAWLTENAEQLAPGADHSLDAAMAHTSRVKRLAFDAGFMRWGWPERVGGLGGSSLLRAYLGAELTRRDFVEPGIYSMTEVLAPTMIDYAPAELAAEMVPKLLSGQEIWCQGFSEPETGSNLGALTCRAVAVDGGWRVSGQKVWTSFAQYAQRCVLLTRTGSIESAHRGITALFVDMDSPGIEVRPIETMHGKQEFSEVFFDDVLVPAQRTLGQEGQGWAVAMDLLPYERSTSLWHRGALLHHRLEQLVEQVPEGALDPRDVGEVAQQVYTFLARSRSTQRRLAAGEALSAETSVDKVLVATAEQAVFELASSALATDIVFGEDERSVAWRTEFLYSRAATIYGGSAEIQRNIIAKRLLRLGDER